MFWGEGTQVGVFFFWLGCISLCLKFYLFFNLCGNNLASFPSGEKKKKKKNPQHPSVTLNKPDMRCESQSNMLGKTSQHSQLSMSMSSARQSEAEGWCLHAQREGRSNFFPTYLILLLEGCFWQIKSD